MRRSAMLGGIAAALAGARAATAAGATVVKVGTQPVDSSGEVFYAKDLGMFAAAGLDVRMTSMPNGQELVTAVISGALDVGLSAVGSVATAREKGFPVKFIQPAGLSLSTAPTDVLMVAKDSPIRTAADLNGKVVGVNGLGNVIQYAAQAWIDKHGGDSKTVKWVEIPFPAMAAALQAHRVDAAMLVEPFVSDAKSVARSLGSAFDAIAPRFMTTGWFATDAWLAKNAGTAARFAGAIRRAGAWANDHHKESGEILLRYTRIKPATLAVMTRATYSLTLSAAELQPAIDVGVRYGAIPHPMRASEIMWNGAPRA